MVGRYVRFFSMDPNRLGNSPLAELNKETALWPELSEILVCPNCRGKVTLHGPGFECSACRRVYPIVRGIPRFVEDESYVSNFGFEWTKHAQTQLDRESDRSSETKFCDSLEISPEKISEKLVLDAGCGMGRFAEVASRYGARVVGVDLSRAVESAHRNLGDRPT